MKENLLKITGLFITAFFVDSSLYAQTNNMQLPSQVGVYQAPSQSQANTNKIQMPPKINYNKAPVMSETLYNEVKNYQSPTTYSLGANTRIVNSTYNGNKNNKQKQTQEEEEEYGVEYYLSLSYGNTSFTGTGLTGSLVTTNQYGLNYDFPLNHYSNNLGDGNNLTIGFGAMSNRNVKVEINYNQLSGLSYGPYSTSDFQWCPNEFDENGGFLYDCTKDLPVTGGDISSSSFSINLYLPIDELIGGKILDGFITPYIGGGIGIAFNTIDDYSTYDDMGTGEAPLTSNGDLMTENDEYAWGFYDYAGTITHFGATTNSVAWNLEAGITLELDKKTLVDLYYKVNNMGTIKSKDTIFYSYETVDILDPTRTGGGELQENIGSNGVKSYCSADAIDAGFLYNAATGWCETEPYVTEGILGDASESGTIENTEIGVKLRLIF